jgi:Skp family chaperone for outer membrane proteins
MLINFLILSNFINDPLNYSYINSQKHDFKNSFQFYLASQNDNTGNIAIVDFRFILKKSKAMKILGDRFISLESEINNKMKKQQKYLKNKELTLKNEKKLTPLKYKERLDLFKKEVLAIQKKFKQERVILNNSFQNIQNDLKNRLAKIIKEFSIKNQIHIVFLKENVFLYNKSSLDITNEVLQIFDEKTKSLKIIITSNESN